MSSVSFSSSNFNLTTMSYRTKSSDDFHIKDLCLMKTIKLFDCKLHNLFRTASERKPFPLPRSHHVQIFLIHIITKTLNGLYNPRTRHQSIFS